jgi:hypothetical protein
MSDPNSTAENVAENVAAYVERVLAEVGPDEFMFDVAIWAIDHDKTAHLHFYDGFGPEHDREAVAS